MNKTPPNGHAAVPFHQVMQAILIPLCGMSLGNQKGGEMPWKVTKFMRLKNARSWGRVVFCRAQIFFDVKV